MRILAWNIRAGGGRRVAGILQQILSWQPQVLVLSEFRDTDPSRWLAAQLHHHGWVYQRAAAGRSTPAQNSVFVASRFPVRKVFHKYAPAEPARWIAVSVDAPQPLYVGGMHIPNQVTGRKPAFHNSVLRVAQRWRHRPAVLLGDTNSGQIGLDEQSPVFNRLTHQWFDDLSGLGWSDAFRQLHGSRAEYTWYSPNRGNGFRLDQAFISPPLRSRLHTLLHRWGGLAPYPSPRELLSDHAALLLDLDL